MKMKRLRIVCDILKRTHADKIISGFIACMLLCAWVILLVEPNISRYGDALWYCYCVVSTIGFGDVLVTTFIGKACSVFLTVYALFVIAVATGVVVSFYNRCVDQQFEETKDAFLDKLERLPELSREELTEISERAKRWHK